MCGICGHVDFNGEGIGKESIERMCSLLVHRGPDDEGMVFIEGNKYIETKSSSLSYHIGKRFEVALGHRRLSIIDLSEAAHQPMPNETKSIWIVYNGEIYNFQEIRRDLEKEGHTFKSNSDTEVILHAYERWDIDCLKKFRGMFAFAIWDSKRKRLFMARDRLGKKPLVYYYKDRCLIFASEIKAILEEQKIKREINISALHHYLTYQYIPSPETIFLGIQKLPPAHYLTFDSKEGLKIYRYWKLDYYTKQQNKCDMNELSNLIWQKFEDSVRHRLISDVPLGAFLSGGLDSSLVVGMMARLSGEPVKTFSIGFEEKDFDELTYAKIISKHFSTDHHEFIVKPNAIEILPKLVWHYNEPFGDSSAIATYYVANMTKDYVKVVLTGDAGDENFAGYYRYLRSKYVFYFTRLPEKIRKSLLPNFLRIFSILPINRNFINRLSDFMEVLSSNQGRNYAEQIKIFNAKEKKNLYTEEFLRQVEKIDPFEYLVEKYEECEGEELIDKLLYLDIVTYLPEDLLVKMDIATMANSLEARLPFLDHQFMEDVARIPFHLKIRGFTTKYILKKIFSNFLPKQILKRRKMGFGVPIAIWFRKQLKDYTYDILLDQKALRRGYFSREGIERLLNEHLYMRYDHSAKIWALLFLEIWFRIFIDGEMDYFE